MSTSTIPGDTVERVTGATREELGFVGAPGARRFEARTFPIETAIGGAVLCPSLFIEHLAGYPQDIWLSGRLAAAGVATTRVHYRGMGHSEGATGDLVLDTMVADVQDAAADLADRVGGAVALVGTRLGGIVAARAAADGAMPLLLIEPCLGFDPFLRDLLRVRRMREMLGPNATPMAAADLLAALERGERIDALGFPVSPELWRSFADWYLERALGATPDAMLVVPRSGAAKELEALAEDRHLEVVAGWDPNDWWLMKPRPAPDAAHLDLLVAWLAEAVR